MVKRRWIFRPSDERAAGSLADRLGISPIAAQVLLNRGVSSPEAARSFLAPELKHLLDPFLFRDMARAAERLRLAAERGEPIAVYGDYDVDGMTGTCILLRLLRLVGARVVAHIPERSEGYGLRADRVAALAGGGVRVIVAVDNGTSAFAAADAARAAGVDLIVADHHPPEAPREGEAPRVVDAFAILNPSAPGETYPFRGLCGAGVAFKLAWALAQSLSPGRRVRPELKEYLLDAMAYAAIGTVADVVPLEGENRAIVRFGLRALGANPSSGLCALVEAARLDAPPTADDVAFRLAPRLNAAGRMGEARLGLEMLAASEIGPARAIAGRLEAENVRRRAVEKAVLEQALGRAEEALSASQGRALVLAEPGWHLGVLGIVAARLVERFWRPAILIALDGDRGRGSGRSVPGIPLPEVLGRCREHLLGFGGHAAAAGLEILATEVGPFRERLGRVLAEEPAPEDAAPPLEIDLEVLLPLVTRALVAELEGLAPHGRGNEAPLFAATGVALAGAPRAVGRSSDHLQVELRQGRAVLKAIGFGLGARVGALLERGADARFDVAFRPIISRWNGAERVELELRDLRPARVPAPAPAA